MDHWFTILIIKPDAFQHRREILQQLSFNGFNVQKARILTPTEQKISLLSEQPDTTNKFSFLHHMCSGTVMILRLHARNPSHNPIYHLTALLGNEDPVVAKEKYKGEMNQLYQRLRAKFGTDIVRNAFYASKSWESAICDAAVFDMY